MSKADDIFISMCEDIIANGTTTEGQAVRPHWEDGSAAYTIKRFGKTFAERGKAECVHCTIEGLYVRMCTQETDPRSNSHIVSLTANSVFQISLPYK